MKKSLSLLVLIVVVAVGCSQKSGKSSDDPFQRGVKLLDSFEFAKADTLFRSLSTNDSTALQGMYGLGLSQERQLLYMEALNTYFTILTQNPAYGPALAGGTRVFESMGETLDASLMAANLPSAAPNDPTVRLLAARAHIMAGKYAEADSALDAAASAGAKKEVVDLIRALRYHRSGNIGQAEATAEKGFAATIADPEYLVAAADYLEERGWIDSAMAISRRALTGGGSHNRLMTHFRRCLRTRYFVDARRLIDSLRSLDKEKVLTTALDQQYFWETDSIRQAYAATQEFLRLLPMSLTTVYYDSRSRLVGKDYFTVFQDGEDMLALSIKGSSSLELQDFINYRTAVTASRLMDKMAGYAKLKEVTGWRQNLPDAKAQLALTMLATGRNDEWISLRDSIVQFRGDQPDWLVALASTYTDIQVAKLDEAEKLYRGALDIAPTYRPAFDSLFALLMAHRKYNKALDVLSNYRFFAEHYPENRIDKGIALILSGMTAQGMALFESNIPFLRGDLTQFDRALAALNEIDAQDERGKLIDLMNQLNTQNSSTLLRTARFENDRGNFQKALELCEIGLAAKLQTDFVAQKARALYGLKKVDESLKLFEEAVARDDGNWEAEMEYARTLALEKKTLIRAENLARSACGRDRSSLRSQLALCDVYLLIGRVDLARGEALKATLNYPEAPEAFYYRGLIMARENNPEARENLQKGISLGLRGQNLAKAQETLKKI